MSVDKQQSLNMTQALAKAESVIDAAEQRARDTLEKANQQASEIKESARVEGLELGKKEANLAAVRMLEDVESLNKQFAEQAAELAIAISSKVIEDHIKVSPETVVRIASKALRESVIGESVAIVVNPKDLEQIKDSGDKLREFAPGAKIEFQESDLIKQGGCLVKTEFGEVDAQIESLLELVKGRLGL